MRLVQAIKSILSFALGFAPEQEPPPSAPRPVLHRGRLPHRGDPAQLHGRQVPHPGLERRQQSVTVLRQGPRQSESEARNKLPVEPQGSTTEIVI